MNFFTDTVTVWRAVEQTDKYGNVIRVFDPAQGKTVYSGVSVQPDYTREAFNGDRVVATTGLKLITAPGMDIDLLSTDRVLYGEMDGSSDHGWYMADGEVARFRLNGVVHHVEAKLKRGS